jgi:SPX domain protein involved in polyphosphate accumulation
MKFERYELKYITPINLFQSLYQDFEKFCHKDKMLEDFRKSYCVHSIYYDTHYLKYFTDKIDGIDYRKKLRVRYYGEEPHYHIPENLWIELKEKVGPVIKKVRFKTLNNDIPNILSGDLKVDDPYLSKILATYHTDRLNPNILISYRRAPLVGNYEVNTRITFDFEIKSSYVERKGQHQLPMISKQSNFLLPPTHFLLEIKVDDSIPAWLNHIIEKYQLSLTAFSKYATGIEKSNIIRRTTGDINEFL